MDYSTSEYKGCPVYARPKPNIPLLIMMCGVPGSGKSRYAESIYTIKPELQIEKLKLIKPVIHSSDKLREEMFGDEATQGDNNKLFSELHKRIRCDLANEKDVIYDATNIDKKKRIQFLKEIKIIPCFKICVVMATSIDACFCNNRNRERVVPAGVIDRMLKSWNPPHYNEGFDYIHFVFSYLNDSEKIVTEPGDKYLIGEFFKTANGFDQENKHHNLSLGEHSAKAATYIQKHRPNNFNLLFAAMLHDNGKLLTKTKTNMKGEFDGNCHYYNHQYIGAYNSLFYLHRSGGFEEKDMVYISNLIYYHMHPYLQWKQSEKALKKDKEIIGERLYKDILVLHEADLYAH